MKKLFPLLFVVLTCASTAFAQSRTLDNFDLSYGVKVATPTPVAIEVAPRKKGRNNLIDRTAYTVPPELVMSAATSLDGYSTGNPKVDGFIIDSSIRHRIDPVLVYATMHTESAFNPRALSYKGASGLMQLMPGTAARFGVTNIFDQKQNIEGGVKYLRYLMNLFNGDVRLTLAGYNAGEGAVMRFGYKIPPFNETQEYVRRITKRYAIMRDPNSAKFAASLPTTQIASSRQVTTPLNSYELSISAVRLPDGRLVLVSQ